MTPRLALRPLPWEAIRAADDGTRLADWADDFPDTGDVVVAGVLRAGGPDEWARSAPWGHHQVRELATGLVVGGAGFIAAPDEQGCVEIGYGIVASRRGRGYAVEAVGLLAALAWTSPHLRALLARTAPDNLASQAVLARAGFARTEDDGAEHCFRLPRPS